MRKFIFIIVMLSTLNLCLDVFALEAKIISLSGEVRFQRANEKDWQDAIVDTRLDVGDRLKTLSDGNAEVSLSSEENDIFKVQPNSTIKIKIMSDKLRVINLSKGEVLGAVSDLNRGTAFEVRTPTAVSGARGTGWRVWTDGKQSEFCSFERKIYVKSFDEKGKLLKEVTLAEGFKVGCGYCQALGPFRKMTQKEMCGWENWCKSVEERFPAFKNARSRMPQIKSPDQYRREQKKQMQEFQNKYRYDQGDYRYDQRRWVH